MIKSIKFIFLSVILLNFYACSDDNDDDIEEMEVLELTEVNDLKVGDTFEYSLFLGESYFDANNNDFRYTDDFLFVEITEKTSNGYIVKEYLDSSSSIFTNNENYYYNKDSIFYNKWIIENNTFTIEPFNDSYVHSHLFIGGFQNQELDLNKNEDSEVSIDGWKTGNGFSEFNGEFYTEDVSILGATYDHLNVSVRNSPMAADGNGNTYIYSSENGFVRVFTVSAWTGKGIGWDKK